MKPVCYLLLLTSLLAACTPTTQAPPADASIVAAYDGGVVTREDLDRAILALPPAARQVPADSPEAWFHERVRNVVFDRLVLAEAESAGLRESPDYRRRLEELRHQTVAQYYIARRMAEVPPPSEDQLRALFAERREELRRPEQRLVWHLFRRLAPGRSLTDLEAEVGTLRQQLLRGANREELARQHSDSESRHQGGSLGWKRRQDLAPELADIIFSLPVGQPSEPIATADGVHLFFVENAYDAKQFEFEESRAVLERIYLARERERSVADWSATLPLPEGSFVAGQERLGELLTDGQPADIVLEVANFRLQLGELRQLVAEAARQGHEGEPQEVAHALLRQIERRERIWQWFSGTAQTPPAELLARLADLEDASLLDFAKGRRLALRVDLQPDRLRTYYEENKMRFARPLALEVDRLVVPLTAGDPQRIFGELEASKEALAAGRTSLEDLASRVDGRVESLGWRTLGELGAIDPKLPSFAAGLHAGEHSAPFRTRDDIQMLRALARREPKPPPLTDAIDSVRTAYLASHRQELYAEWVDETLGSVDLVIFDERLTRQPDTSPADT